MDAAELSDWCWDVANSGQAGVPGCLVTPAAGFVVAGDDAVTIAILAGFAPCEVWSSYPLLLPGAAALELPGATEHPGYPLALAVSAVLASFRADVSGAEEFCRRAADARISRPTELSLPRRTGRVSWPGRGRIRSEAW